MLQRLTHGAVGPGGIDLVKKLACFLDAALGGPHALVHGLNDRSEHLAISGADLGHEPVLDPLGDRTDGAGHVAQKALNLPPHELHVLGRRGPLKAEHPDFQRPADQVFPVGWLLPAEVFRRQPARERSGEPDFVAGDLNLQTHFTDLPAGLSRQREESYAISVRIVSNLAGKLAGMYIIIDVLIVI